MYKDLKENINKRPKEDYKKKYKSLDEIMETTYDLKINFNKAIESIKKSQNEMKLKWRTQDIKHTEWSGRENFGSWR